MIKKLDHEMREEGRLEREMRERYILRLYIAGAGERSSQALVNLKSFCEEVLRGHYELEVIDIYQQPERIGCDPIVAAPTLVRVMPRPVRCLAGELADRGSLIALLDGRH